MKDILDEIVAHKRREVAAAVGAVPPAELERIAVRMPPVRSMRASLEASDSGIIAEFKRRSPSKGWINRSARPETVVPAYAAAGAAAVSILTDESYFGGSLDDLRAARPATAVPVLRKEFVIDPYQLLQARAAGADAVLLIAAALTREECRDLTFRAHELGLEVLLEIHSADELDYVLPQTDMVGVNNRDLGTFRTDVDNSVRLAGVLPPDKTLVSESGISSPDTVVKLRAAGFRGFLIGENFMRNDDPAAALAEFVGEVER